MKNSQEPVSATLSQGFGSYLILLHMLQNQKNIISMNEAHFMHLFHASVMFLWKPGSYSM